jgi:signal transduction histidine kinase
MRGTTAFHVGGTLDAEHLAPLKLARRSRKPGAWPRRLWLRAESLRYPGLWLCLLVGGATTLLITLEPALRSAALTPALHGEIAALTATVALVFALLAAGRFRRTHMPADLFLSGSLAMLGLCNLSFSLAQGAIGSGSYTGGFDSWMPLMARVLSAGLLACAALAPRRPVHRPRDATVRMLIVCAAILAGASVLALGVLDGLAHSGHQTVGLLIKGLGVSMFALAAVGFAVDKGKIVSWFSVFLTWGATLLAFAWLDYMLTSTLYVDWLSSGLGLGLVAYIMFAAAATSEMRFAKRSAAWLAVMEERERMARELHDGLAQELAYLVSQTRRLDNREPSEATANLASAAERALCESRVAISSLRAPLDEPLVDALERIKRELGNRLGLQIGLSIPFGLQVSTEEREILLGIIGEALANAARHGHAGTATIEIDKGEHLRLLVSDDGIGFDTNVSHTSNGSYGLLSMRERAESGGGRLDIRSAPGSHTEIEATLP